MKLSEALIRRADAQKRLAQLRQRLSAVALVQEGDMPPEDPTALLAESERVNAELNRLVKQINRTNAATPFDKGRTVTDALADRDALMSHRTTLSTLAANAAQRMQRYSRSEVRYISTVNVAAIQAQIDDLARQYRDLDTRIQEMNWQTDLME